MEAKGEAAAVVVADAVPLAADDAAAVSGCWEPEGTMRAGGTGACRAIVISRKAVGLVSQAAGEAHPSWMNVPAGGRTPRTRGGGSGGLMRASRSAVRTTAGDRRSRARARASIIAASRVACDARRVVDAADVLALCAGAPGLRARASVRRLAPAAARPALLTDAGDNGTSRPTPPRLRSDMADVGNARDEAPLPEESAVGRGRRRR